jgi:hypothetical protein
LAYVIVSIGNFKIQDTSVVICGLLSYKFVLTVDCLFQALSGLKYQKQPQDAK